MERNYITDRETYLKMKDMQKHIMTDSRRARKAYRAWEAVRKLDKDNLWNPPAPKEAYVDFKGFNPREFNIVYGIVKGRKYEEIEQKVKPETKYPKENNIKKICEAYKLPTETILADIAEGFYARRS